MPCRRSVHIHSSSPRELSLDLCKAFEVILSILHNAHASRGFSTTSETDNAYCLGRLHYLSSSGDDLRQRSYCQLIHFLEFIFTSLLCQTLRERAASTAFCISLGGIPLVFWHFLSSCFVVHLSERSGIIMLFFIGVVLRVRHGYIHFLTFPCSTEGWRVASLPGAFSHEKPRHDE